MFVVIAVVKVADVLVLVLDTATPAVTAALVELSPTDSIVRLRRKGLRSLFLRT